MKPKNCVWNEEEQRYVLDVICDDGELNGVTIDGVLIKDEVN